MEDSCFPGPALSPSYGLASLKPQERLDHGGLGLKEVSYWEEFFEHDIRGDWGRVWDMQELEEQKNGGDSPMRESSWELSTECSTSVTDGTSASSEICHETEDLQSVSSTSETASMSPAGTSQSTDEESICGHPGCGKVFQNRDKLR